MSALAPRQGRRGYLCPVVLPGAPAKAFHVTSADLFEPVNEPLVVGVLVEGEVIQEVLQFFPEDFRGIA